MPKFIGELAWAWLKVFAAMSLLGCLGWRDYNQSLFVVFDAIFPSANIINEFGEIPPRWWSLIAYFHLGVFVTVGLLHYAAWRARRAEKREHQQRSQSTVELTRWHQLAFEIDRWNEFLRAPLFWVVHTVAAGVLGNFAWMFVASLFGGR
jgi:hypothetical protein